MIAQVWRDYRDGLAYGRRIAEHARADSERALRLEVKLAGVNPRRRARALGELRGYRQAQP
jgi:hypothetical protein